MNKITVLVVDDEQPLRDFVGRNLQKRYFQVHTAANGMEAVAVFQANDIDLVIMDLMMPRMDGIEAIGHIRRLSLVPIIVLSALEEEHHKVEALNQGVVVDRERYQVTVRGKPLELTPTEYNLLVYFMENPGKVLPHEIILRTIWGPEYGQEAEYLRVYIGRLRQKIEVNPTQPRHLLTERGIGYSFEP